MRVYHAAAGYRRRTLSFVLAGGLLASASARADEPGFNELAGMSLEQLANLQITSVSRASERLSDAPASVYVITADDIRRAGVATLPEALRLAPNLQVAQINASQYAISSRGFNSITSNKLQVLIDGRVVYTPLYSGVFWDAQDMPLDDVERIEVISGPASTLWGGNAVNGAINVITKKAGDTQGGLASLDAGNRERGGGVRYGAKLGEDSAFRVYAKTQDFPHTDLVNGQSAQDAWRRDQAGFRADFNRGGRAATVQGDLYREKVDQAGPADQRHSGANLLGRWQQPLGDGGATLQLQGYLDHTERLNPGVFGEVLDTINLEAQHSLPWSDGRQLVWGGGYRYADDKVSNLSTQLAFLPSRAKLHWGNLFAQWEKPFSSDWKLIAGARLEHNNFTGFEFMPNLRLSWKPAGDRLVWAALTRSARVPSRLDDNFYIDAPGYHIVSGGFQSEIARTLELGYRSQIGAGGSYSVTAFNSLYDKLRSVDPITGGYTLGNSINGRTMGLESWASYRFNPAWRLAAGLALMHESFTGSTAQSPPGNDPRAQWSLRPSWQISEHRQLSAALRHVGALQTFGSGVKVDGYTVVDASYNWQATRAVTLTLALDNLFDRRHVEFASSASAAPVEIGRAGTMRLKVAF
ncbi:TonB-dependent receptor plug domain-containing protein [Chromobacterium phragmitis]|uniref:TonB-dependent receptor n=3 Tax=Chromobacterium phragmitis TaxID=2202141 RepID=A0ABV0IR08_9NEIS